MFARELARAAHRVQAEAGGPAAQIVILGPAEAPIAVLRGRSRFRLLVKAPRAADLQAFLRDVLARVAKPKGGVRVAVDIDPQNFL